MRLTLLLWLIGLTIVCPLYVEEAANPIPDSIVTPPEPNSRYPFRVADWLWASPAFSGFVKANEREGIEVDIRLFESLRSVGGKASDEFDRREKEIAARVSKLFAVRDFTVGQEVIRNTVDDTSVVVLLDPLFTKESQHVLRRAISLYLQVATDLRVIQSAIDQSVPAPTPQPEMYELVNGEPAVDQFGNKIPSADNQFARECRVIPPSAAFLRAQLKSALPSNEGDPGLLVVSHCVDKVWWGGGYYGFLFNEATQLKRELPARGYLYIRLNQDKMTAGNEHFDDPAFWAGKLAHEILHNLSYWHPSYADPTERDLNNPAGKMAFIVAYERAVAEAASRVLTERGE